MPVPEEVPYEIVLRGLEAETLAVEEFANFLRDLVFLHDRVWIMASKEHLEYDLAAGYFYTRYGKPIPEGQRLQLTYIKKESPYEVGMIISSASLAAGAAWLFFQIVRGVLLLPGEIRKQRLEESKLRKELGSRPQEVSAERERVLREVDEELKALPGSQGDRVEENLRLIHRDIERISENRMRITEVEVRRSIKTKR